MKIIEIEGGGFHPGIPAAIAGGNCRVKMDDAGAVIEVVPLGSLFSDEEAQVSQEMPRISQESAQISQELPRPSRKASQS